jgi:phthiodiolone/phenolphthiodiolone dimycocerosates ketoreductase
MTKTIRFGVHHGTNAPFLKFQIPDIVRSALLADELGFDSIWVMDHLNWTPLSAKTQISDAFVVLGHLADKIKKATLGTCVSDPHRRHPAQLALAALTMQDLTKGRFILGIGAGEGANLIDFGVPWNKCVTRLTEASKVLKLLWSSSLRESANFKGEFFNLKEAGLQFKVDTPPKLYVAANSPKTIELAAEVADGWIPINLPPNLYKKQLALLNQNPRASEIEKCIDIWISVSQANPEFAKKVTHIVATNLIARKETLEPYGIDLPEEVDVKKHFTEPIRTHIKHQTDVMNYISKNVPENIIDSIVLGGSPSEVIEQINNYVKAGVEHFIFEFVGDYFTSMKEFAEKVMPAFK